MGQKDITEKTLADYKINLFEITFLTDDDRFELAAQEMNKSKKISKKGGSGTTMCEVLDKVEARGIATGVKETLKAMQLISKGYTTAEELCEQGIPEEVAEQVVEAIS